MSLRSGNLSDGPNGGFLLSVVELFSAWFDVRFASEAKALFSWFILVFLSSAN